MNAPLVVIKVGGSLLDWSGLGQALGGFLRAHQNDRTILVVGGGAFADVVRTLDQTHQLGEETAHHLALRALDLSARVVETLGLGVVVEERDELEPLWHRGETPILAPRRLLDEEDRGVNPLPHTWECTTDSIAARVAERLGASELIMLKSTTVDADLSLEECVRRGWVDPVFPRAARLLPKVRFVNLREWS